LLALLFFVAGLLIVILAEAAGDVGLSTTPDRALLVGSRPSPCSSSMPEVFGSSLHTAEVTAEVFELLLQLIRARLDHLLDLAGDGADQLFRIRRDGWEKAVLARPWHRTTPCVRARR
jgi:hypothetical protein